MKTNETSHDPSEYIRGIQQILISDKKRIGFLFGAGTSLVRKNEHSQTVPAISKMTVEIMSELTNKDLCENAATYKPSLTSLFWIRVGEVSEGPFTTVSIMVICSILFFGID